MAILIKGMEMPEDCIDCFAETYNECMVTGNSVNSIGRPDWCPLVEVPKHGRLIDADALNFSSMLDSIDQGIAEETVMDAPTIIEAEE